LLIKDSNGTRGSDRVPRRKQGVSGGEILRTYIPETAAVGGSEE